MSAQEPLTALPGGEEGAEDLPAFCANPSCRKEFRRKVGPGRRQEYCAELCRRTAERDYRRTLQRLAHLESQVEQHRALAAAFSRSATVASGEDQDAPTPQTRRRAEDAVARAGGVVGFVRSSEDLLAVELCSLYDAVAPVLMGPSQTR